MNNLGNRTKVRSLIIFDMDGTLYDLRGGSYRKSPLRKKVLGNAQKYVARRMSISIQNAKRILRNIQERYDEDISIGLEREFRIDRYDYFDTVWDIPARGIVTRPKNLRKILLALRKDYEFALVSDAPRIWIHRVLEELGVQDIFKNKCFSGEGDQRKGFGNIFAVVARKIGVEPRRCIVVGDQENTDILPASRLGMRTIFVHPKKKSSKADVSIHSLSEIGKALRYIIDPRSD